jgi:hypothetical protein
MQLSSALGVQHWTLSVCVADALRLVPWQTGFCAAGSKKCNNFRLAMCGKFTASCMSTRTATLLLVVDGYSQVLGAAVHQYSQLIRNLNPPISP